LVQTAKALQLTYSENVTSDTLSWTATNLQTLYNRIQLTKMIKASKIKIGKKGKKWQNTRAQLRKSMHKFTCLNKNQHN